jgi:hypothetical protein
MRRAFFIFDIFYPTTSIPIVLTGAPIIFKNPENAQNIESFKLPFEYTTAPAGPSGGCA